MCPAGCSSDCKAGYCISCDSGRYLSYDTGLCPTCSSAIANCATCTSSASGVTCTACNSGYILSKGECFLPLDRQNCITYEPKYGCKKCESGYYIGLSGRCIPCPPNGTCSGTNFVTCNPGYANYANTCRPEPCDGISTTPAWCAEGYIRIEGKGCCAPNMNPDSSGACMLCAVR